MDASAPRTTTELLAGLAPKARYNVLFLCRGNSARSIIAEATLNFAGGGEFRAHSAGFKPTGFIHPSAEALLRKLGLYTPDLRSKPWYEFTRPDAPQMDFIFSVCDSVEGERCLGLPGRPITAHWGVPDPAAVEGPLAARGLAFAETYRLLNNRINLLLNLPIATLDRVSLRRAVRRLCDQAACEERPGDTDAKAGLGGG